LQRFRREKRKQFKQDFYNWKQQQQQRKASSSLVAPTVNCDIQNNKRGKYAPIIKASEVGITLRTQDEHAQASKVAVEQSDKVYREKFIGKTSNTPHLFQSQTGSVRRLENSQQLHPAAASTEFVNPNHFASDIAAALNKKKRTNSQQCQNLEEAVEDNKPVLPVIDTEDDPYMSYVEYIQLDVDSKPCDQFRISASFDSCHEAYIRFLSK